MMARITDFFRKKPETAFGILIVLLAFLQYANTLGHDYAWDDALVITENPRVQKGFAGIPEHFSLGTRRVATDFTGYRPLTMTTFSVEYALFGPKPFVSHLVNVLLFSLCCWTLFLALHHLFPGWKPWHRFLAVLLFVVHPLHVEVVANIKSRDEIMALMFGLLALQFFIRHCRAGRWIHLVYASLFLVLAVLSKENALMIAPAMGLSALLLIHGRFWPRFAQGFKALVPLAAVVLLLWGLTGRLPGQPSPVEPVGFQEDLRLGNTFSTIQGTWNLIGNVMDLNMRHIGKFFYPRQLVYYSGYNQVPVATWSGTELIPGWTFSIFVLVLGLLGTIWRRTRGIAFGLFFYAVTILIYLHVFQTLADTIADRYMFMPSVGLCIVVVGLLRLFLEKKDQKGGPESKPSLLLSRRQWAMVGIVLLCALPLSIKSFSRNQAWKNNLRLFETDIAALENCSKAHFHLAEELGQQLGQLPDVAGTKMRIAYHYERSIEISPLAYYSFDGLGNFLLREGDPLKAADVFERMSKAFPQEADPWYYLGKAKYEAREFNAAITHLTTSKSLRSDYPDTWELLGRAYTKAQMLDSAMAVLETGIQRFPEYDPMHDALSNAYFEVGDTIGSFRPLEFLRQRDPMNPDWWKKIIGRYQLIGNQAMASQYYQMALQQGVVLN